MRHPNEIEGGVGFAAACVVTAIGVAIVLAPNAGASTDPDVRRIRRSPILSPTTNR
jgi:hypothetical protein